MIARFLTIFVVTILFAWPGIGFAADAKRPNVITIMVDDYGYECVGANGGGSYQTPNIDRLAATGARFTHCYVQPLCTPTRVQLMTGIYNVRNYVHFGLLDPKQTTFAQLLQGAGYSTCIVGKWQLGRSFDLPKHFGFDEYCLWQLTRRPPRYANPGLEINGKEMDYSNGEYGPDIVNDYALDYIARKKDQPFFLYYPMMLTHNPFQPTPDSADWDPKAKGEQVNQKAQHFVDMVAYTDKLVGKLVAKLESLGLRENTLILFTGDNGTGRGITSRLVEGKIDGGKGSTTDAGMHAPLIANWPGVIPAGKVSSDLVDSTDFLPTICEAAGVTVPAELNIDGRSFLPRLRGEKGMPREWIYCWYSQDGTSDDAREFTRNQNYKLYRDGAFYDVRQGDADKKPLNTSSLDADALAAKTTLQAALDKFKDARPAHLLKASKQDGKKAAKKEAKKKSGTQEK